MTGGLGAGGSLKMQANGSISAGAVEFTAGGIGGSGDTGGDGSGGDAAVTVTGSIDAASLDVWGGSIWARERTSADNLRVGQATLTVASGGDVTTAGALSIGAGAAGGDGATSAGTGLPAFPSIDRGCTITAGDLNAGTQARPAAMARAGGDASAGDATIIARSQVDATNATVHASAHAGQGSSGPGGEATGGNATLTVDGGNFAVTGQFNALTNAVGGGGTVGGLGTGGTTIFSILNGGIAGSWNEQRRKRQWFRRPLRPRTPAPTALAAPRPSTSRQDLQLTATGSLRASRR